MDLFKSVAHYLKNTDLYLAVIAFICSGYGMALIYSATLNPVSIKDDGSTKNLYVQGAAILIGFGAFVLMSLIDLEGLRNRWKNFVIVNICLQLLLFTPLGMEVNGQRAWLNLGVTSLQPGELGKLIFIFTMAAHISEVGEYISELRGLAVIALHTLIMMAAVVVSSGDSGMAIQYFMIAVIMLFAAGLSLKWIALGAGVAVAGAFGLVRFRSAPGTAKEIGALFLAMAIGLATGMGYVGLAVMAFVIVSAAMLLLTAVNFGGAEEHERVLKITIPESLDYDGLFDDLFEKYTKSCVLERVKTSNMGTLYELTYRVTLPDDHTPKAFLDELRCRNGNLNITCGREATKDAL